MENTDLKLNCPLCCNETFSSIDSLKYHLLSLVENIFCPNCSDRFEDIQKLIQHLDEDCTKNANGEKSNVDYIKIEMINSLDEGQKDVEKINEQTLIKIENDQNKQHIENSILAQALLGSNDEVDEDQEEVKPTEEEAEENSENTMYLCQMCNINFNSIEDHLERYHQGEEVLLETEDGVEEITQKQETVEEDMEEVYEINYEEDTDSESNFESGVNKNETLTEEECIDNEGRVYTRKVVKIDKFWMERESKTREPNVQKYRLDKVNSKIIKITDTEAEEIEDKTSIIKIYSCPNCTLQFPHYELFFKHKCRPAQSNKPQQKYRCEYCNVLFNSLKQLQTHLKTHVADGDVDDSANKTTTVTLGPYECNVCQTKFPSFKSLRLHSRMHEPVPVKHVEAPVKYTITGDEEDNSDNVFTCPICEKSYNVAYKDVHLKSHTDVDMINCKICNRKFRKDNIAMHMKAHSNVKKFTCSYCKKAFVTFDALNDHITNQCQKRQYECQFCGRRFSRPHEKVKHERIHTGEKPHVCEVCGKAFRVSYCLTLHMRTHSGTRPYQCEHCNKRFKSHSAYNHHIRTHSDVRAYKCPFCPKAFKTMVQLAGHKNSHIKPFSCTKCNRPFASLYAVRAHMETHTRDNNLKYDCWLCGASYARAFALKDHMKAQHGDQVNMTIEELQEQQDGIVIGEEDVINEEVAVSASQIEVEMSEGMEIETQ